MNKSEASLNSLLWAMTGFSSRSRVLLKNPVAVEKLTLFQKIRENNFASRFDLSDVFEFKDILHPPNFGLFGAEREFFNSHACLQQLTLTPELPVTRSELKSA